MTAPTMIQNSQREIRVTQARSNNLKGVDLVVPHGQWVAFCGLSGSGKSSLAFDTMYAEGQRRYVECLSPKTRQFVRQMAKPDADGISGVPPAIAIRPSVSSKSQETVGSATEVDHLMSELFVRSAIAFCPTCGTQALPKTKSAMAAEIALWQAGSKVQICYPIVTDDEEMPVLLKQAMQSGFVRAIVRSGGAGEAGDGNAPFSTVELSQLDLASRDAAEMLIVVDRVVAGKTDPQRIEESLELAMQFGNGRAIVFAEVAEIETGGDDSSADLRHAKIDGRKWKRVVYSWALTCSQCDHQFAKPDQRLFQTKNSSANLDREGAASEFRFCGLTIGQWSQLSVAAAVEKLAAAKSSGDVGGDASSIAGPMSLRLEFLHDTGLGYLQLDRSVSTLSSGERQRVKLATVMSSTLVDVLYVLDEPAMGLHPAEVERLNKCIGRLHQKGNTVLVVDHNADVIMGADRVIEIGPGAGAAGGEIVFDGSPQELVEPKASLTGEYIGFRRGLSCRSDQRRRRRGAIGVVGASTHNLKDVSVDIPLGGLCAVTGVSGSGKSSLLIDTVHPALLSRKGSPPKRLAGEAPKIKDVFGDDLVSEVVLIDGLPIGRTGRSNPVTYVKAFDDIRKAFAETVDARTHGISAGQFSFNVAGGRCEKCSGEGVQTFDMQFLSDIHVKCDECLGARYRAEVLNVRYRDKNIAEVLDLTVREAFLFFRGQPKVQNRLKALIDVGLEYVRLGQPATTLSSGEAQRLKLASWLNSAKNKRVLFIMDEPTTGLHMQDVTRLLDCFDSLITAGHSLVVIEHNLQLIKNSDFVIDMGPGAGDAGGTVVASGTPEEVAANDESVTGGFLKKALAAEHGD